MKILYPDDLRLLIDEAFVVDVRTPVEYRAVHLEGSRLRPLVRLEAAKVEAEAEGRPILIICQSGARSRVAAQRLEAAGLGDVGILEGGIEAWEGARLPVIRGVGAVSLERQVRIGAGTLVVTGVGLGLLVNPLWALLAGFVGAGLVFAGITNTCGMAMVLARMPWNQIPEE